MHMKCIFLTYPRTSINGFIWWNNNIFCYFPLKSKANISLHITGLWFHRIKIQKLQHFFFFFFFSSILLGAAGPSFFWGLVIVFYLIHHLCLMVCWPSINWAPGCQTIGESHSGDTETLWHDGYRFIRSRACSAFGNYSLPIRFNCLFELGAGGLEGLVGLPA